MSCCCYRPSVYRCKKYLVSNTCVYVHLYISKTYSLACLLKFTKFWIPMMLVQCFEVNSAFLSVFTYSLFFREQKTGHQPLKIQGLACSTVSSELTKSPSLREGSGLGQLGSHPAPLVLLPTSLSLILWVCKAMHTLSTWDLPDHTTGSTIVDVVLQIYPL